MPQNLENDLEKVTEEIYSFTGEIHKFIVDDGPKVLLTLLFLFVGLWLIKLASKLVARGVAKSVNDVSLVSFIKNLTSWTLRIVLFISIAGTVGIPTTSFVTIIGAAGLAIGLALQGSLSNFAGGVLLMTFKPYKVGDFIETQGEMGTVDRIQIFHTILTSMDNKAVIIPNGPIMNGNIINYTHLSYRRVDATIGIAYDANIKVAKDALMKALKDHPKVLKEPTPIVAVSNLGDSSVDLAVRPHCKPEDYWDVYFDTLELGKAALDEAGITIPFPQRDVHVFNDTK